MSSGRPGAGTPGTGTPATGAAGAAADPAQDRTLRVLVTTQALGGLGNTVGITVASVLAEHVSGSESLAGLVQTMQVVGAAAASYLLSRVMGRSGRRVGLVTGYLVGTLGAALCVVGGAAESYALLLVGGGLLGFNSATNFQSRYAAADLASPGRRARALSTVLWATTLGAVLGPNLVGPAGGVATALDLPELVGPFLVAVPLVLAAALVLHLFLRPDPLLLARERASADADPGVVPVAAVRGQALRLVVSNRGIGAAVLAMSSAHAVMVGVMGMTPLHMDHGGAVLEVIGLVISIHILGMFFFSPFLGVLADRVGRRAVLVVGAVLLLLSLVLAGTSPMGASVRIGVGLFLLGLGWSCCTVAASALLTESTALADRTAVQGLADLIMNGTAAVASLLAGVVVDHLGFGTLNVCAAVLVAGVAAGVVRAGRPVPAYS